MARLDSFLRLVAEQQASDLHFHAGGVPLIRHDGELLPLPFRSLSALETRRFVLEILTPDQVEMLESRHQVDFVYALPEVGRFRANVFAQSHGLGAVFRVIRAHIPSLAELGCPATLHEVAHLNNGLVIVTGPTGAGKSTTMAAMIHEMNVSSSRHIITIEDPVEFVHEPVQSVITHREVGTHTGSFGAGLRAALRQAPDVIVLGELRDQESVQLGLQAAETGALVLGTLHTNSAATAVDRMLDVIPEEGREQARGTLSLVLRVVVAQRLVRLASGDGRIAVFEVLVNDWAIANMIRENKVHQVEAQLQSADTRGTGNQSFDSALLRLVREAVVTPEEALLQANYPDVLQRQIAELAAER